MITKLLPATFDELYLKLVNNHTKQSLKIELDFLYEIGKIKLVKGVYSIV